MPEARALERDPSLAPLIGAAGEIVFHLAQRDPLTVCRALARAIRHQTPGAKAAILRRFADALDEQEPGLMTTLAAELARHFIEKN